MDELRVDELAAEVLALGGTLEVIKAVIRKGCSEALESADYPFCANCGRAILPGDKAVTGPGIDHEEICCSRFCHDQHEELGCPQGVPHGGFRDSEWYGQQLESK